MRPSQRYCAVVGDIGSEMGSDGNSSCDSGVVLIVGGVDVSFLLGATEGDASDFGVVPGGDCCTTA